MRFSAYLSIRVDELFSTLILRTSEIWSLQNLVNLTSSCHRQNIEIRATDLLTVQASVLRGLLVKW